MRRFAEELKVPAVALGAAALLYTLVGFLFLPMLIRSVAESALTSGLGRNVTIERVELNPYAFSLAVHGFQIDEPNGEALLLVAAFAVNFELWSSLWHRSWVFVDGELVDPQLRIVRNADGTLNFADLLLINWPTVPPFRIDRMRLAGGRVTFDDHDLESPFSTTIGPLTGNLTDFSMSPEHDSQYSFSAFSEEGEKFSWKGTFRLDPLSSSGELNAEDVRIGKYYPYFEQVLDLKITDGMLTARTMYDLDLSPGRVRAVLSDGTIAAGSLKVVDRESGAPFFGLAAFAVSGAHVDFVQQKVEVDAITVTGGSIAFRRLPDHSFNIQGVLNPPPESKPAKALSSARWQVSVGELRFSDFSAELNDLFGRETGAWKELRISKPTFRLNPLTASLAAVTLEGGRLTFTDVSASPPVVAALTGLDIRIGELSLDDPRGATVAVTTEINHTAELQISGKTNPFHPQGETDLRGLLQHVNLVPLSSYAGKYLGYELAKGELSLDVKCKIERRKLNIKSRLEIAGLTLGRRTDSEQATGLPVQLALALLKDLSGNITLDIPVSGTLDDPKFEPTKAIVLAVLNPITQIIKAPFAALGARLGGGGEELGFQAFPPGSARLPPQEKPKLDRILLGMKRWPELVLDIEGSVDKEKDGGDLQVLAAARAMAVREYLLRQGGLDPGRVFLVDTAVADVPTEGSRALLRLK